MKVAVVDVEGRQHLGRLHGAFFSHGRRSILPGRMSWLASVFCFDHWRPLYEAKVVSAGVKKVRPKGGSLVLCITWLEDQVEFRDPTLDLVTWFLF
jgi:hypothetical protein